MSPKKIITYLLRKLYLLPFVDRILLLYHIQLNKKSNNIFGSLNPDFICPPNDLAFDAYNHTNWKNYHHHSIFKTIHLTVSMLYQFLHTFLNHFILIGLKS